MEIPKRTERVFNEMRGEYRDIQIEDRPYRLLERQYSERKGCYEDVEVPLTDMEIMEAGGLEVFFDGDKRTVNWPWSGKDKRKVAKKKVSKKK